MIDKLHSRHQNLQQKFNITWLLLTMVFIGVVLYVQFGHIRNETTRHYEAAANSLAFKIDEYIENLLESVHTLPLTNKEFQSCTKFLRPKLQSIMFNNPYMSGIVISGLDNKVLCSTLYNVTTLPATTSITPVLLGPLQINSGMEPVFLLQQRMAEYHLGVYVLESILKTLLKKDGDSFTFIGLYDNLQKKMLLQTGKLATPRYLTNDASESNFREMNNFILPLQNLDNVSLLINAPAPLYNKVLLAKMALMALPLIVFSWLLYLYSLRILKKRFSLNFALNNALRTNQFFPVYQAIWDQASQRYCGAEVLMRWAAGGGEVIMPDSFIGEAEKTGIIVPMTLQVIEKSFKECQNLLHQTPHFHLAFNLGPTHFQDEQFFSAFFSLCTEYAIPPSKIMLELTERELFNQDDSMVVNRMNDLRASGYSLAIDDFGTGQSNINYLQQFPFNYLKIDKIFISSIGTGAINETLNQSIIVMAQSLHLNIIAEGVETQQQSDYLYKNNVNFIQGWLYAKALPYKEFAKVIRTHNKDVS